MVELTKSKILTSSAFQIKAGKVTITEKRYNLSNKMQGKEIRNTDELTNSVKKKLTGMIKRKEQLLCRLLIGWIRYTQPIPLY